MTPVIMATDEFDYQIPEVPQKCEVCSKVVSHIRVLTKNSAKNKKIEKAIGVYCDVANAEKYKVGTKEKKICYYFDPIKKLVAQPIGIGLPEQKVCERLSQQSPEICEVQFVRKAQPASELNLKKMRVKQLKKILKDRNVECVGCTEKQDYIRRVEETNHMDGDL
jgi:hypothetical protein